MPWEYVWIACSGIEAERIFETIGLVGSQYVCKWDNMEHVKEYLFKIFYTYMDNIHNDDELLGWFYLIFSKMQKNTAESTQPDLDYFVKAERYIQHNYGYDIQLRDCMMVSSCQGVCNVLLTTAAVAAVLWLTVNGIANDTVNGCILLHKRNIVSSSAIPCRHGRCHPVRASIASINAVVLVDQRLVSIKRPERAPANPALAPATERS